MNYPMNEHHIMNASFRKAFAGMKKFFDFGMGFDAAAAAAAKELGLNPALVAAYAMMAPAGLTEKEV